MQIGSRASPLALTQAKLVADMLEGAEIMTFTTAGDRGVGPADKSRWVDELEQRLLDGEIDLAVHSAKDVPGALADGLEILGAPTRAQPQDVLCGAESLQELRQGARVGSSSLRRRAQLKAARADLEVVALAGNVDTRIAKLKDEGLDAIVLAHAGLARLGRHEQIGGTLDFVPAPGQGTLALEGRCEDLATRTAVQKITDQVTFVCLRAERALAQALSANCHTPLGAYATRIQSGALKLSGWVGLPDGSQWIAVELIGDFSDPERLGAEVAGRMLAAGASQILQDAEAMTHGYT